MLDLLRKLLRQRGHDQAHLYIRASARSQLHLPVLDCIITSNELKVVC